MNDLLTKCSYCGKFLIGGRWVLYYSRRIISEKEITHGICESCRKDVYAREGLTDA